MAKLDKLAETVYPNPGQLACYHWLLGRLFSDSPPPPPLPDAARPAASAPRSGRTHDHTAPAAPEGRRVMTTKKGRPSGSNGESGAGGQNGNSTIEQRRITRLEALLDHLVSVADVEAIYAAASDRASDAALVVHLITAGESTCLASLALLSGEEVA
jgi:hypothetical protein